MTQNLSENIREGKISLKERGRWLWLLIGMLILIIILSAAGAVYQFIASGIDRRNFPPPGQMVDLAGYQLHLHCMGSGSPTVIMESGFGGTSLDWGLVQPQLARETRVCVYDRAGLGWSEQNPAQLPRTSEQIAGELHQLLAAADIPAPYILAGLSAGGMHVQAFADRYPSDVLGLVLLDPTPAQFMAALPAGQRQSLLPNMGQLQLIQILETVGALRFISLPGSEVLQKLPADLQRQIRAQNVRSGIGRALSAEAAGIETSIMQTAGPDPIPTELPLTIIWHGNPGENDEMDSLAENSLRELAGSTTNGRFVIAESSGHTINFDRPDIVIEEIARMISMNQLTSQ